MPPTRVLRVITRLNIGGPAINAALLSTRLDPDRFVTLLVAGSESASEGSMLDLGRLDAGLALRRVPALGRAISPIDDVRALAAVTKIDHSLRLNNSASSSSGLLSAQPSRIACRRAAALSSRSASNSRGFAVWFAIAP